MAMTWEEWKIARKYYRRHIGATGWILLVYYLLINIFVFLWTFGQAMSDALPQLLCGNMAALEEAILSASESGWGYFLAAGFGLLILLLWKKPRYFKEELFARGKPMGFGRFLGILIVFLGTQFLSQLMVVALETALNLGGWSILEGMELLSVDSGNFSMFLYAGILAPVSEEILFRGLIQRRLLPYGRNLAIFASAFTFGLFHGNLIQTPFAFLVGLILGYVACEYSVFWSMLLHMINNLVVADMMTRLTAGLPEETAGMLIWLVLLVFALLGAAVLLRNRKAIGTWIRKEPIRGAYLGCFFGSLGVLVFLIVMLSAMIGSFFMMIAPI